MVASAHQLPLQRHHNRHLFSDYYLNELLPRRPEWESLVAAAGPAITRVGTIVAVYAPSDNGPTAD